jgi:hypothetical protein
MALFTIIIVLLTYIFYLLHYTPSITSKSNTNSNLNVNANAPNAFGITSIHHTDKVGVINAPNTSVNTNIFNNPYTPPVQDLRQVQMQSGTNYSHVGILTQNESLQNEPIILPLMGRRIMNKRDKLQYYAISNTGSVNSKLPIKINGRSCTDENGCDEIYTGDVVYVAGYNASFIATVYETANIAYIPF